jgi:hypothetical protein
MRKKVVKKPWLPSPASDLAHRQQADAYTHCCFHSVLQELGASILHIDGQLATRRAGQCCEL